MGVRRLTKFITDNPDVSRTVIVEVDLKHLASQCRANGGQSVIVIDGLNFLNPFLRKTNFVCGGELKSIAQEIEKFVAAFEDAAIELVFFLDGPFDLSKINTWLKRRIDKMYMIEKDFENVDKLPIEKQTCEYMPCLIPQIMKEAVTPTCKVVQGIEDHDKEMARYVVENKCLGIFSNDTDFFIFDGLPHVFTFEGLDVERMIAKEYRREALASCLYINPKALPLFATLMGNDTVVYEDSMRYLRRKFPRQPLSRTVMALARIANTMYEQSRGDLETCAVYLAREIYQHDRSFDTTKNSLLSYDYYKSAEISPSIFDKKTLQACSKEWSHIVERCLQKYIGGCIRSGTLSLVARQIYSQSEKFEDSRSPCAMVLSRLRRRTYSVVLYEKSTPFGGVELVEEFCAAGPGSLDGRKLVQTEKVEVEHPGLLRLWDGGQEFDDHRWRLVWWIVFPRESGISYDSFTAFRNLPDHFVVVALVLAYLFLVAKKMDEKELTAFTVMAASVPEMDCTKLSSYSVQFTTKRAVSLVCLFQQTLMNIRAAYDVCGLLFNARFRDIYSGQLFHYLLKESDPTRLFGDIAAKARENYTSLRLVLHGLSTL